MLDGTPVEIARPADAMALGIRTVYQELSLLPHLSVAENVLLGRMPARGLPFIIDWREANRIAGRVLADFGFPDLDPSVLVGSLSVARQQIVEIAKALVTEPSILILDEPTAVLSASETERLFAKVRSLAAAGGRYSTFRTGWRKSSRSRMRSSFSRTARAFWPRGWPTSIKTASSAQWWGGPCRRSSLRAAARPAGSFSR